MRAIPVWQALPPFKIGCGRDLGSGMFCSDYPYLLCRQCDLLANVNVVMRDTLRNACVSVLERARCEMLGSTRTESFPISDVTDDFFTGVEIHDVNRVINNLQDMVKEIYSDQVRS